MDDNNILQHLLEIEDQAATLIDDAQAAADRRIKEAEDQNRVAYDEAYQQLSAELETEYQKAIEAVKKQYDQRLDEYTEELRGIPRQDEKFSALAFSLLVEEE